MFNSLTISCVNATNFNADIEIALDDNDSTEPSIFLGKITVNPWKTAMSSLILERTYSSTVTMFVKSTRNAISYPTITNNVLFLSKTT